MWLTTYRCVLDRPRVEPARRGFPAAECGSAPVTLRSPSIEMEVCHPNMASVRLYW